MTMAGHLPLYFVCAHATTFDLAMLTLEDEPMRSRTAHRAAPEQNARIGLDDTKTMGTPIGINSTGHLHPRCCGVADEDPAK